MLVWQPPQLGTAFASDGYVWADAETALVHEHNGEVKEFTPPSHDCSLTGTYRHSKYSFTEADFDPSKSRLQRIQDVAID